MQAPGRQGKALGRTGAGGHTLPMRCKPCLQAYGGYEGQQTYDTDLQSASVYTVRATPTPSRKETRPAVATRLTPRPKALEPEPVPIIHSSAYQQTLVQNRISPGSTVDDEPAPAVKVLTTPTPSRTMIMRRQRVQSMSSSDGDTTQDGSAIEWALRKADASLDELEVNPLPVQKVIYGISRGPVGTATTQAVQAAAKLTMQATVKAAQIAAPIGKWALTEGAKAAMGLIKAAVVEGAKAESRNKANKKKGK